MMRVLTRMSRKLAAVALLAGIVAALAAVAWGYFTTTGTTAASATVGTLGTSTLTATPESPGAGQITLSWTAVNAPASIGTVKYYIVRSTGTVGGNCPSTAATATTALTCHDDALNAGGYSYQVVALWQSWSSTSTSAQAGLPYGPLDHFAVGAPASAAAGTPFNFAVTAKDASNNTVSDYTGTIHFTSADSQASLPSDFTFSSTDAGSHTFAGGATLKTAGSQSITATDTSQSSVKVRPLSRCQRPPPANSSSLHRPSRDLHRGTRTSARSGFRSRTPTGTPRRPQSL